MFADVIFELSQINICIVRDSETVVDGGIDFDRNARNFGYFGEEQDVAREEGL